MSSAKSLRATTILNAVFSSSGQILKLVLNFVSLIVLARILSPEDYGLTALSFALIGVADFVKDMGLSTASIQTTHLSVEERNNLWWANTMLGFLCTFFCCVLGPIVSYLYNEPRLTAIVISMSLVFVLSGMTTQFRTDLIRKLKYGRLASWEVLSSAIALSTALIIATNGGGYWALVAQQLVGNFLALFGTWILAGWFPGKYNRNTSIKKFFAFGIPLFTSNAVSYLSSNLDTILLGKFFGNATLGSYNRANQMVRMPMNQLRSPLNNVMLSALGRVREDRPKYLASFGKAQSLYLYPIVFLAVWIALISEDVILVFLGEKWQQSIPLVTIFAIGDALTSLSNAASWVYLSEAKSKALFKLTLITTALRIVLFVSALNFGVNAVAAVYSISSLIMWPTSYYFCTKDTGISTKHLFLISAKVAGLTSASALVVVLLDFSLIPEMTNILHMAIMSILFISSFIILGLVNSKTRNDILVYLQYIKSIFAKFSTKIKSN